MAAPHYVPNIMLPVDPPAFPGPWIYPALLGDAERSLFHRRYPAIWTRQREQALPRISTYNFRIPPADGVAASLRHLETVHLWQAHGYKLNASVGAIMAHKVSGRLRYFHASANNYRLLVSPATVERIEDLGSLQGLVDGRSWTDHAAGLMPDSAWRVVCVTNMEYYVYHDLAAPIQGPTDLSDDDDDSDGDNVAGPDGDEDANSVHRVRGLAVPELRGWIQAGPSVHSYKSHLCIFKCMAWLDGHQTSNALMRGGLYYFHRWRISREGFRDMEEFPGLTVDDLESVETMFSTGFQVYTQDDNEIRYRSAQLLRHPLPGMDRVVNVHLEGDQHFRPIEDLRMYARRYKCMHCGSQWCAPFGLERHQANCQRASRYRYKGGPYRSKPRFYELLAPLGVVVAPEHRYYPYKATFDLEACLVPVSVCTFTSWHVPMSVSLPSNVPSYEGPYNFISDGCPQRLVDDMMSCLWDMSDATYRLMRQAMDPYCSQLDDLSFCQGKETECPWDLEETETEAGCMLSLSTGARALTKAQ